MSPLAYRLVPGLALLLLTGTAAAASGQAPPAADRHGDPLPPGAVARLGTNCFRQAAYIRSLSFSPDGKTLAAGGYLGPARLWDVATGQVVRTLPHVLDRYGDIDASR